MWFSATGSSKNRCDPVSADIHRHIMENRFSIIRYIQIADLHDRIVHIRFHFIFPFIFPLYRFHCFLQCSAYRAAARLPARMLTIITKAVPYTAGMDVAPCDRSKYRCSGSDIAVESKLLSTGA